MKLKPRRRAMLEWLEEDDPLHVGEQLIKEYWERYGMGKDWTDVVFI
jgi:hypothetical protein